SPDGRRLVVDSYSALHFFQTGTWELSGRRVWERPGVASNYRTGLSFTQDGTLLAVSRPTYEIKLVEPATARVLATLPSEAPAPNVCFPHDADRLLCSGLDLTVQTWDLSRLREQLAPLGLNWE
ncbi:MAG: hypothetical protein AAF961_14990, partial [Planctomycetota bacterium]